MQTNILDVIPWPIPPLLCIQIYTVARDTATGNMTLIDVRWNLEGPLRRLPPLDRPYQIHTKLYPSLFFQSFQTHYLLSFADDQGLYRERTSVSCFWVQPVPRWSNRHDLLLWWNEPLRCDTGRQKGKYWVFLSFLLSIFSRAISTCSVYWLSLLARSFVDGLKNRSSHTRGTPPRVN